MMTLIRLMKSSILNATQRGLFLREKQFYSRFSRHVKAFTDRLADYRHLPRHFTILYKCSVSGRRNVAFSRRNFAFGGYGRGPFYSCWHVIRQPSLIPRFL